MRTDEIEKPEHQCLDPRQRRNRCGLRQCAVCFNQYMNRQRSDAPGTLGSLVYHIDHSGDIGRTLRFWNGDVADLRSRLAKQQRNVIAPVRMLDVMDSYPDTARWRLRLIKQAGNHQRMVFFVTNRRAVLAVAGQIESPVPFALQIDGFTHHFLVTGDMVAGRDDGHLMARGPQRITGMNAIALR